MDKTRLFSEKILQIAVEEKISSKETLNLAKLRIAKFFALKEMPSNPTILSFAKNPSRQLKKLFSIKPIRSLSGVAVVAVMTKPFDCVGKCIYCPSSLVNGKKTPKSYTGKEPATMRGLMYGFDAFRQADARIKQLVETGHNVDKIELIAMGGTFLCHPLKAQEKFVLDCFNAANGRNFERLRDAKNFAEHAKRRIVGFTFETRPDQCSESQISRMLDFGGTRCELGVQIPCNEIYKKINRGHSVQDVIDSTQRLKDSCFKVGYHLMPGLYGSSPKKDLKYFKEIFSKQDFRPDMLKIYPCLVVEGTKLHGLWKAKKFEPYSTEQAVKVIAGLKKIVPKYVRIMRIQRDIPVHSIEAGVKKSNIRQLVENCLKKQGIKCNCIRCREAGLNAYLQNLELEFSNARLLVEKYKASNGFEFFVSVEDVKNDLLLGFGRLRIPFSPFREEIGEKTALLRELHVYGAVVPLGKSSEEAIQHNGIGKRIVSEIERIAFEEFDSKKLLVISGIGVKEYYRNMGFRDDGLYVSKPGKP